MTNARIALAALQGAAFCALLALPAAAAMDAPPPITYEATEPDVFAARACIGLAAGDEPTAGMLADVALSSDARLRAAALVGDVLQVRIGCAFAYPLAS